MSSIIPKKGDIVINPKTQRPVKVGSRVWLKLVKEGIFKGHYRDPNELEPINENETLEEQKKRLNEKLPKNQQAVKGRGKHKGKIVKREKGIDPVELSRYTSKSAVKAVKKNIDRLALADDDEDIDKLLEKMIFEEMMNNEIINNNISVDDIKPKKYYDVDENDNDYEEDSEEEIDSEYEN